jgi:hypothetical protein
MWYRRHEVNFRIALFFSAATIAGAFGGLLARLINLMDDVGGLEGWRWIFILEGILTFVVALASFWMLYDYPDTAKFLTDAERVVIAERLSLDTQSLSTEFKKKCESLLYPWLDHPHLTLTISRLPSILRLQSLDLVLHVHWRAHAGLRLFSVLTHVNRQSGIHRRYRSIA